MIAIVQTGSLSGIEAIGVRVEVTQMRGLPGFDIVGLPEASLRESRVRVLAALSNCGYQLPDRRFVVNLAPADVRKSGASFDLAIALALLAECGLCPPTALAETLVIGELSLDGQVRPVAGTLAQLRSARCRGLERAIIPHDDSSWAELVASDMRIHLARELRQVVQWLDGTDQLDVVCASARASCSVCEAPSSESGSADTTHAFSGDLNEVCGQAGAKRALEIAAAGGHNLLMVGPPGAGKTMLASRLATLLPQPNSEEALEIATIASAAGLGQLPTCAMARPFRAPHHSCSEAALIGGGNPIRPGEVTLAHGGVLFLDELPEFRRNAIEALRPTMESGVAVIVRARQRVRMPACPLIVAAMNPCPCGFAGDAKRICRCSLEQIQRYRARVSGPVIDRFDLHIQLPPVSAESLRGAGQAESSRAIRARVVAAHARAATRREAFDHGSYAARIGTRATDATRSARLRTPPVRAQPSTAQISAQLQDSALKLLVRSIDALGLSLRAYAKVLRVARTIADLADSEAISALHVGEAIQYRVLDRDPRERTSNATRQQHVAD